MVIHTEKAGELGRKRIRTVGFIKYILCPTTFFALTFFFLTSVSSGNNQLSFSGAGELRAEQVSKIHFPLLLLVMCICYINTPFPLNIECLNPRRVGAPKLSWSAAGGGL